MLEYGYFLAAFLAGAFFATFFAGAFFGAAFFAGAFFAGMSYPPFHSAVAEDKKFTTRLTNEHSSHRQSEINRSREFLRAKFSQKLRTTERFAHLQLMFNESHTLADPLQHLIRELCHRTNRCNRKGREFHLRKYMQFLLLRIRISNFLITHDEHLSSRCYRCS